MLKLIAPLTFILSLAMPWNALSQVWLPDRADREGPGFKLGEKLLVHPGAVVEGGYDSNPLLLTEGTNTGRLRLSAYLDAATRSGDRLAEDENALSAPPPKSEFRLGLATYYDFYFSKNSTVDNQDALGIDTHLNFLLFPGGKFSLLLNAVYQRSTQPYETPRDQNAHHTISPTVGLSLRPGGGTLTLSMNGGANVLLYEDGTVAARNNKATFRLEFETSWNILPKTAVVSIIRFSPTNYLGSTEINVNSRPIRGVVGIRSLFTPKFGLSLFFGYGASFYERGDDFESIIANADLAFFISPSSKLNLGASRDFEDSFYANYFVKTGGYLKFSQMIGHLVQISLKADAYYREYSFLSGQYGTYTPNTDYRIDTRLGGTLLLEFRATDWLSILASCMYQGNISNFAYSENATEGSWVDYQRVEVMGGVQARY